MTFRRFFLVRLAWALFGAWLAVTLVFVIFFVLPANPARLIAGPQAWHSEVARTREAFHLDDPLYEQYARFVWRIVSEQSPGRHPVIDRDAGDVAFEAAGATLSLLAAGLVVWLALAIPLGLLAASVRQPKMVGRALLYLAIGASPIWAGLLISYYVGYKLALLPIGGYCDFFNPPKDADCGGALDWAEFLVLPAITLALFFAAIYARVISRVISVSGGRLGRRLTLLIARMLGRDFGYAIGAATLIEVVFGIPGLGNTLLHAIYGLNLLFAESAVLLALLMAVTLHFLVDVIVAALDPELRKEWPVAAITGRA